MKGTRNPDLFETFSDALDTNSFERATGAIVYTIIGIAQQSPSPIILWPTSTAEQDTDEEAQRSKWSQELERHFRDVRRCARKHCPVSLLPRFEDQLCEIEATVRAAVAGRLSSFLDLSYYIRQVEDFRKRWIPYLDPPQAPPPRVRYNETDRSVWLDGRCIAKELNRKQFGFVRALVDAYPDPVTWNVISQTATGCRGGNQTRLRNSLPRSISQYVESGPDGYVLRLPDKLSTAV
jgi:hypothetical protein